MPRRRRDGDDRGHPRHDAGPRAPRGRDGDGHALPRHHAVPRAPRRIVGAPAPSPLRADGQAGARRGLPPHRPPAPPCNARSVRVWVPRLAEPAMATSWLPLVAATNGGLHLMGHLRVAGAHASVEGRRVFRPAGARGGALALAIVDGVVVTFEAVGPAERRPRRRPRPQVCLLLHVLRLNPATVCFLAILAPE